MECLRPLRRSALKVVKHWSDQWEQQGAHDVSLSLDGERMGWDGLPKTNSKFAIENKAKVQKGK